MNIYNNDKEPHINEIRRLHYKTKQRMSLLAERKKYYIYCYHESTWTEINIFTSSIDNLR